MVLEHVITSQTLILSDHIVDELIAYLKLIRPKISQKWVRGLREHLQQYCYEYDLSIEVNLRDPHDNPIVALALTQNAFVVSGDKDLLEHTEGAKMVVLSVSEYQELFVA